MQVGDECLSQTLVEAILGAKYPAHLTMKDLMEPSPCTGSGNWSTFSAAVAPLDVGLAQVSAG